MTGLAMPKAFWSDVHLWRGFRIARSGFTVSGTEAHSWGRESVCASWFVAAPVWLPASFFASVACGYLMFHAVRRRRRRKGGLCLRCGYDLRGSLEAGRCPECGTGFDAGGSAKKMKRTEKRGPG